MNKKVHRIRTVGLLACLLLARIGAEAQPTPGRVTYALKGSDTLWMHCYEPQGKANGTTVVFVHGGAFTGGDPQNQRPFAEGLTRLGYKVFVVKYRLYLKGKSFGCETVTTEKLAAIRTAVDDVRDATGYIVRHAAALGVDTSRMFLAGSSAGAETVLNLVFNPFLRKGEVQRVPYRGVLSFAGAVLDITTLTEQAWIPLLMMHGTSDQLVPFGTAAHRFCRAKDAGWLMLFGSHTILEVAKMKRLPAVLYTFEGSGHEVSNYMFRRFSEMDRFMQAVVAHTPIVPSEIMN